MYSDVAFFKLVSVSRKAFWLSVILMLNPFTLFLPTGSITRIIAGILFNMGSFLMIVSWVIPGMFMIAGRPWYALAWSQGLSSKKSLIKWEQLSKGKKVVLYFQSYFLLLFVVAGTVLMALNFLNSG